MDIWALDFFLTTAGFAVLMMGVAFTVAVLRD
jgi:hypothetical protein